MATTPKRTIDTDDDLDRWRFVCPNGHRTWEPTNYHFWCSSCAQAVQQDPELDVDPEFDQLHDKRTDELLERDEVEIEGYRATTA